MTSTAQPRTQPPSLSFCGLDIYAHRDGDLVTGCVRFPYETYGRTEIPIYYYSIRGPVEPASNEVQPALDARAKHRLEAVEQYGHLLIEFSAKGLTRCHTKAARQIAKEFGCSARSIQSWVRRFELGGAAALQDRQEAPPKKIGAYPADVARDAVLVVAWWSFRIGNVGAVDFRSMDVAVKMLSRGYQVADLLAVIDCYYAWPCDRQCYPFRLFAKWAKYDLDKWTFRACDQGDYRRALAADYRDREKLQPATKSLRKLAAEFPAGPPDAKARARDTRNHKVHSAMHRLAGVTPERPVETQEVKQARRAAVESAKTLGKMISPQEVQRTIAATAPGIEPLASDASATTLAEFLAKIDPRYRAMLLKASGPVGSPEAKAATDQAAATLPLWWEALPPSARNNIAYRVDAWRADHPHLTTDQLTRRKVSLLLADLRRPTSGVHRLSVAARLPA